MRGVELWNVWKQVDHTRVSMLEKGPFKAEDLMERIKGERIKEASEVLQNLRYLEEISLSVLHERLCIGDF